MLKNFSWVLLSPAALAGLAVGSIHCSDVPADKQCLDAEDCGSRAWTNYECSRQGGHWECSQGICFPVCAECATVEQCVGEWTQECHGHFACTDGECGEVCDPLGCSDGICNMVGGETIDSCPEDCAEPCEVASDCLAGYDWDAPCQGHWACQSQDCVEICTYDTCSDGMCDSAGGEDADSCPGDCVEGCRPLVPSDCFSEQWAPMSICQGRWNCLPTGVCDRLCDSNNCGDGVCWGLNGENEDSCFVDCLGGPCDELIDCMGQRWDDPDHQACQGHWQCNPADPPGQLTTGACEAVCGDAPGGGCGDGSCDTLDGETPVSCLVDCGGGDYACTTSGDCSALTLPSGCTGDWICAGLICVPQCE